MCDARLPRRRTGFTLVELLVVIALILAIAAIGIGYAVFGQSNQHSVVGANAVTGAMLNTKQRAHHDGVPTGVRILFDPNTNLASQIALIQQPDDYTAGQVTAVTSTQPYTVTFSPQVDLQGGAAYPGQIDQSTVQAGDYFLSEGDTPTPLTPHLITSVVSAQSITLASPVPASVAPPPTGGIAPAYYIIRAPRRLASEDIIQLPPTVVIDGSQVQNSPAGTTYSRNVPIRYLVDSQTPPPPPGQPAGTPVAEIVFGPAGAVVGQGTGKDKIFLWLRDPSQPQPYFGVPLIVSIQVRTGLISVYPVAPWDPSQPIGPGNDPYRYGEDGRASGI